MHVHSRFFFAWGRLGAVLLIWSFFFTFSAVSAAADEAPQIYDLVRQGHFQTLYSFDNGLPTSEANSVVQTPDGFIWIASYSGLTQYDGKSFRQFDADSGIRSIFSMFVDSGGRLWLGTNDRGIALLHQGGFVFYGEKDGLAANSVRSICENAAGEIVVATTGGLSTIGKDGAVRKEKDTRLAGRYIRHILATKDGGIAGLTNSGDFFQIAGDGSVRYIEKKAMPFAAPKTLLEHPYKNGSFIFGTDKSHVVLFTPEKDGTFHFSVRSTAPLAEINQIKATEEGVLWVCADNGIGFFDENLRFFKVSGTKVDASVDAMLIDYEKNFWFASSRQGVLKVSRNRFFNVSAAASLPPAIINAATRWNGKLHVGTDQGLAIINTGNEAEENELTRLLDGKRIRHLLQDRKGRLLISTYSDLGLIRYSENGSIESLTTREGLPANRVRSVLELSDGALAVATKDGLAILRDDVVVKTFGQAEGLSNTQILTLCEGKDGSLYAGSDGAGIFVIKNDEIVANIGQKDGLDSGVILRLKKDPKSGDLWILTGNTLACLQNGKVRVARKFPFINNYDLLFSGDGSMWILNNRGVCITAARQMFDEGPLWYLFYGSADGLPGGLVANSFSEIDDAGLIYLCTQEGVVTINTRNHNMGHDSYRLAIPDIVVDDKIVPVENGQVTIPAGSRRVTIEGRVLTNRLNNPYLATYLEGFDEKPLVRRRQDMTAQTYTNLPGGSYIFHLQVLNDASLFPRQDLTLTIHKEPNLLERPLIVALLCLALLALIYAAFRCYVHHRTRGLLKKSRETQDFLNQVIQAFARAIEFKDAHTRGHSSRVAKYSAAIAAELGFTEDACTKIYNMGMLHDVGKIVVPDQILSKPGPLSEEEYATIKKHASVGSEILQEISRFPEIALGAKYHHERCDGKGYPEGVSQENIPLEARIIAAADVFDAMSSNRPYRQKLPKDAIVAELLRCSGTQLDEKVVRALLQVLAKEAWV